jgi:hypothetical protein
MISLAGLLLATSTKAIEYIIAIAALIGFLLFLKFLGGPRGKKPSP